MKSKCNNYSYPFVSGYYSTVGCFADDASLNLNIKASFDLKTADAKEREEECLSFAKKFQSKMFLVYTNGKCKLITEDLQSENFLDQSLRLAHPQIHHCSLNGVQNKVLHTDSE